MDVFCLEMGRHGISINKQDHMAFPFWIYYDSTDKSVMKAESSGITESVLQRLDRLVIPADNTSGGKSYYSESYRPT